MKKRLFFVLPFSILMLLSSCSMEKRLYRKGYYTDRSQKTKKIQNHLLQKNEVIENFATYSISSSKKTFADLNSVIEAADQRTIFSKIQSQSIFQLGNFFIDPGNNRRLGDDSTKKRMTHREAKKLLAEKGGKPNKSANTVYWLSIISVCTFWFGGSGILLGIFTLI